MTLDNRDQLISLAQKVFDIIQEVKEIEITIDEMQIKLKGIHIGRTKLNDIS